MNNNIIYAAIIAAVVISEFFIKKAVEKKASKPSCKKIYITKKINTGFLYSLAKGHNRFAKIFCGAIVAVCTAVFFIFNSNLHFICGLGLSLVLGGGISNTADRFIRGGVLDYIAVKALIKNKITIYNTADFCILIGALIVIVSCFI